MIFEEYKMEVSDDKFIALFEDVASIKTANNTVIGLLKIVQDDVKELKEFNQHDIPTMIETKVKNCQNKFHPDADQPEDTKKENKERRRLTAQELKYKKALTISVWIGVLSLIMGILLSIRSLIP